MAWGGQLKATSVRAVVVEILTLKRVVKLFANVLDEPLGAGVRAPGALEPENLWEAFTRAQFEF